MQSNVAQKGKFLLVRISDGGSPTEFIPLTALRPTTARGAKGVVDTTNKDSADWQQLMPGGEFKSLQVSGTGIMMGSTADSLLRQAWNAVTQWDFQVNIPGLGTYQGAFEVTGLEYQGDYNGAAQYTFTLQSAGPLSFTAGWPS